MRLIDADAFDERVRAAGGMSEEELSEDFKDGVQTVLYMMSKQPTITAQPEERTQERTETHACDCVSRKDAVDLLDVACFMHIEGDQYPEPLHGDWIDYHQTKYLLEKMPSAQPEEAISVAWLEEQAKWFESMDNAFAKIEANNIRVMIKKYRSEKDERSD